MKQRYNVFDTFGLRALNKCVTWVKFVLKQLSEAISLAFFLPATVIWCSTEHAVGRWDMG